MLSKNLKNLTHVINTRGTFTPLGVSRSSPFVCEAVADALSKYFVIEELHNIADKRVSKYAGSEAATVTHCCASAITLSVAATMTGLEQKNINALPDTSGMANQVIIPSTHCVNYGQSILQAIRLSGAMPVIAGSDQQCTLEDIEQKMTEGNLCCLLLVSSKLVFNDEINLVSAVKIAHKHKVPVIIDGAAQDLRVEELIQTGADLVLVSAQKYLAGPTAGLIFGKSELVSAVRAQEKGIGRGMKATKESLIGVLAAIEERGSLNLEEWKNNQKEKVEYFIKEIESIKGVTVYEETDPTGLPFSRIILQVDDKTCRLNAPSIIRKLKSGDPSIWVIDQNAERNEIGFELVQVTNEELKLILSNLKRLLE